MARCKSAVATQTVFSDRYLLGLLVIKHTSWGGVNRHCDTKCYALSGSTCCRSAAKTVAREFPALSRRDVASGHGQARTNHDQSGATSSIRSATMQHAAECGRGSALARSGLHGRAGRRPSRDARPRASEIACMRSHWSLLPNGVINSPPPFRYERPRRC